MSFTITTPSGTTSVAAYTVPRHGGEIARYATREAGGVRVVGDGMPEPRSVRADLWLPADTYAEAMAAAFDLIEAAEAATSVAWHWGTFEVAALAGFDIRAEANGATVTLTLLLANGSPA